MGRRIVRPAARMGVASTVTGLLGMVFGGTAPRSQPRPSELYQPFFEQLPSMTGKTVVVTGASRGLGYVTALSVARKGAAVILVGRKSAKADAALAEISEASAGPSPQLVECDLLDFGSVRAAAASLREQAAEIYPTRLLFERSTKTHLSSLQHPTPQKCHCASCVQLNAQELLCFTRSHPMLLPHARLNLLGCGRLPARRRLERRGLVLRWLLLPARRYAGSCDSSLPRRLHIHIRL